MVSSDRILLRLHIEAVWGIQLPRLILNTVELLPESARPSWKFYAAELSDVHIHIWRPDVDAKEREGLLAQVKAVFSSNATETPRLTISREVVLQQRASPTMSLAAAQFLARSLTPLDRALIEVFESGSADYYLHADRAPCIGVIVEGSLLSVAHSSRRTTQAYELGIDTLPQARRRGYALAATILWTNAVVQEELLPLYSASADNMASLRLANAAGYRVFARGMSIES